MLLNILIENERQMLYVNLNREDYSCYSDEQEVLLQAGLSFKLLSVEKQTMGRGPTEQTLTVFNLYISDASVNSKKRWRKLHYLLPFILYGLEQVFVSSTNLVRHTFPRDNIEIMAVIDLILKLFLLASIVRLDSR